MLHFSKLLFAAFSGTWSDTLRVADNPYVQEVADAVRMTACFHACT